MPDFKMLVVDDEAVALKNLVHVLKKEGYAVISVQGGPAALRLLEKEEFSLVLTDLSMEKVDGMQILKKAKELWPDCEVIMITGFATVDSAVEAMKAGAYSYVSKPYKLEEVRKVVREAVEKSNLKTENRFLKEKLEPLCPKVSIITGNERMKAVLDTARQVADSDSTVMILGESGTGKELVARFLHSSSRRKDGPFVAVNCGAFAEDLLANELFGHVKGAFTGAHETKKGLVEMANRGTLFLDEVTELSLPMQVKLLRVIQEKEILPIGGSEPVKVDVRFIAATNRSIRDEVKKGTFRQDLYYRLNVVALAIPPLSERKDDIPLLIQFFLLKYSTLMDKKIKRISQEALEIIQKYDFPGNVRELENIIERGIALTTGDSIEVAHLPEDLKDVTVRMYRQKEGHLPTIEEHEKIYFTSGRRQQDLGRPDARYRPGLPVEKAQEVRDGMMAGSM